MASGWERVKREIADGSAYSAGILQLEKRELIYINIHIYIYIYRGGKIDQASLNSAEGVVAREPSSERKRD